MASTLVKSIHHQCFIRPNANKIYSHPLHLHDPPKLMSVINSSSTEISKSQIMPMAFDDTYSSLVLTTMMNYTMTDMTKKQIIASLNANRHILFGAQLNIKGNADDDNDEYMSKYLAACGSLLDIAKEDASINGQQVQALATLNGLCSWVKECLDNDGEGSQVLMGLMHGKKQTNDSIMDDNDSKKEEGNKLPSGKRANQKITNPSEDTFVIQKKTLRKNMLEAVRAIATGEPRPGHSVVGAGTYRDGEKGWVALAREYTQLATNPDSVSLDASYVGRKGLEEVALYKSRDGEVTKIEHLGHAEPGYLKEAGGAMARLFFV